jgi:cytochrome c oxidase subunit 1
MHPEVYILIIPSFGLINYQLSQYTSNYIFGSISMILALISILIFGSLVWAHHMFTVNLESDTNLYFSILTLVIAIPTGTKLYNWLFLIYSQPYNTLQSYNIPLLYCYLFLLMIIFGGITGVILGNNILDIQLHDTYFVVSHFHYILSIGSVLSIFLTLIQISSYISPVRISKYIMTTIDINYLTIIFILLNVIFLPMYYLGFNTLPRRIPDYADYLFTWNSVATIGVIALYTLFLILIVT